MISIRILDGAINRIASGSRWPGVPGFRAGSSLLAFLRFSDALRDHAGGRVVEAKATADLLQGLRADTDQVDQLAVKSGTSAHCKLRISKP